MKPKLLIVHMSLYSGGAERSLINFLATLPPDEYDIDLLLFRTEGAFLDQLPKHVRLLETPEPLRTLYYNPNSALARTGGAKGLLYKAERVLGTGIAKLAARSNDNLRRQKRWLWAYKRWIPSVAGEYDVAIGYFHGEVSYFVMDNVRAKRKIAWVHNDYDKTGQSPAIDRPYFEKFDKVASISPLCVEKLQRAFPGLEGKFTVVPNLTSAPVVRSLSMEFEPPEFRKDAACLLSVGRLAAQKACDISVEAAAILRDRGLKFTWYLLGEGGMRPQLEEMIREKGLEDFVELLGIRPNPYPYMRSCDIFVQNSRYEGKSMVLDEAKILRKPIVVTEYPTVADQIERDEEGLVVPITAEGVANGLERMLRDASLRSAFTKRLSEREYGNTKEISLYRELLSEKKPASRNDI